MAGPGSLRLACGSFTRSLPPSRGGEGDVTTQVGCGYRAPADLSSPPQIRIRPDVHAGVDAAPLRVAAIALRGSDPLACHEPCDGLCPSHLERFSCIRPANACS